MTYPCSSRQLIESLRLPRQPRVKAVRVALCAMQFVYDLVGVCFVIICNKFAGLDREFTICNLWRESERQERGDLDLMMFCAI